MNVVIVDDESIIRRGIRTFIPWDSLGCTLSDEAENGRKALEIMEDLHVDIIITDIRMPIMDGLELSREVRKRHPHCRIIILSGYEDFEYAREALRFQVSEYLLKPVGEDELTSVLRKTVQSLAEERKRNDGVVRMKKLLGSNRQSIIDRILGNLITGEVSEELIADCSKELCLDQDWNGTFQTVILFSDPESAGLSIPEKILTMKYAFRGREVILLLLGARENESFLERLGKMDFTAAAGSPVSGKERINESYRDAVEAAAFLSYLNEPALIRYSERERFRKRFLNTLEEALSYAEIEKRIIDGIRSDESVCSGLLSSLLHYIILQGQGRSEYIRACRRLYEVVLMELKNRGFGMDEARRGFHCLVSPEDSWPSLLDKMKVNFGFPEKLLRKAKAGSYSTLTNRVISYIESHFKGDISLSAAAESLAVSESHLSRIFKKDTGLNFIPWINRFRVNYSREFLISGDLKLSEVADLSGFNDSKYYTLQFRKYYGISPSEYRNNHFSRQQAQE